MGTILDSKGYSSLMLASKENAFSANPTHFGFVNCCLNEKIVTRAA